MWASEGHLGCSGCQGCIGASRDSRYSGVRRHIGHTRGHWMDPGGAGGNLGVSGASRGVGGIRVY